MDGNQTVFDDSVRYAVFIERYKNGAVRRLLDFLLDLDIEATAKLTAHLERLSARDQATFARSGNATTDRLKALNAAIADMRQSAQQVLLSRVTDEVTPLAERVAIRSAATAANIGITAAIPSVSALERLVTTEPFQGNVLSEWAKEWSENRVNRANQQIRLGLALGEATSIISRRLIGTRSNGFRDGILNVSRRGAEAIVRTAATHARSVGDVEFARVNEDSIDFLLRRAVLDSRTSEICQINDGVRYTPEEAEGVIPAHIGCRSVFITVWRGQGRPEDDDYFEWLRRQPVSVQDEVLGVTKGRLFRDGGLDGRDLIRQSTGQPYTLDQLRAREAQAFEGAGIE